MKHEFIETIKLLEGYIFHLQYHQQRVCTTFAHFFPDKKALSLSEIIPKDSLPRQGKHKIRIVYSNDGHTIEVLPYQLKPIHSIKCVDAEDFDYKYKFSERGFLNALKEASATDEVIFIKNGKVTDSSYANIIFYDGHQWVTPSTFLLNGTCRQRLLNEGKIKEAPISYRDIPSFQQIGFINAMLDIGELTVSTAAVLSSPHFSF